MEKSGKRRTNRESQLMLKIVDVDWENGFELELEFSDGFRGTVDLTSTFKSPPFNHIEDFTAFSLEGTCLDWDGIEISANKLRDMLVGEQILSPVIPSDDIENILKHALWDAIESNRPDIFQAVVRSFVEEIGIQKVQERTTIKSRPSIYKTLRKGASPKLDTLIQLSHAVLELKYPDIYLNNINH